MSEHEIRYQNAINDGHSAAWEQDWVRAASFFKQAIDEKPEDPKALNNLALALFEVQEFSQALQIYLKLIELTPNDPVPMEKAAVLCDILKKPGIGSNIAVRAAELYLKDEDIEKALENWSRAVVMNPENVVAHSRLALVYERLNRITQAVREYLHIASLMQFSGDQEKATQVVHRALKLSPQHDEALQALTMIRDNIQLPKPSRPPGGTGPIIESPARLDEPLEELDDSGTPIDEACQKALSDLATLFFEQSIEEREEEPAKTGGLRSIVDGTGPLYAKDVDKTQLMFHLGQAVEFLTSGVHSRAEIELERVIEIGLHHPSAYFQLGSLRLENDRLESALRYLKKAVSHKDLALGSRLLIAEALMGRDQLNDAVIEYLEALKLADSAIVPKHHSDGLRQLYEPLIEAQVYVTNDEGNAEICKTIAEMLIRPKWRQYLKNVRLELVPLDDGPPTPLADVLTEASSSKVVVAMSSVRQLVRDGRRHAAFEEALFALEDAPTYLPLHITIAELLLSGNQIQGAIEKFKVIARSYSVRGETDRAIDMFRRVVDMSPMDVEAHKSLIDQLVSRGQIEDAIKEYLNMGEVYYSLAELSEARKTYTRALRFAEQSGLNESWRIRIFHRIADIDVQSLNWRQGLTIYQKILAVRPNDIDASNSLVDLNFRLGERAQALNGIEALVRTLNNESREEEGCQFLEKLSKDWSEQAMIKSFLAEQYIVMDRVDDAIAQLDLAREIFFDTRDKKGALNILKRIIELEPDDIGKYQKLLERITSN